MPSPIDPSGALLGAVTICQDSTPPSEAALLKNETSATINNETKASQAHNFAEESSEEDDDDSIFCEATNLDPPPPEFLHNFVSIHDKPPSPFKLLNSKKKELPKDNPAMLI